MTEVLTPEGAELSRHMARYSTVYDGKGGVRWQDTGGLWCSGCGWEQGPDGYIRPWNAYHNHVAAAVAAIALSVRA